MTLLIPRQLKIMSEKRKSKTGLTGFSQKAFVFNSYGNILTMRRTKTAPSNPLKWDLPGGDVEFGEDPIKSMVREIKEETGFIVKNPILFGIEAHITPAGEHWITLAYKALANRGKLLISREHDLHKWVTIDEFLKLNISKKLKKLAITLKNKELIKTSIL